MDELSGNYLLYADDQIVLPPSACDLQKMVTKINDSVKKIGIQADPPISFSHKLNKRKAGQAIDPLTITALMTTVMNNHRSDPHCTSMADFEH
ncbi:hypothetical protein EVAR_75482_1 [Eumeta japonica]|uniref:Reverse transcriptase domain-containing protein n=1 Tax=Eumeta variegata TaxID=151549 RepID=A0A4C1TL26_EUMVA|nr:hypothetical protein EVAR_75482_1 [Eumeta japonica]